MLTREGREGGSGGVPVCIEVEEVFWEWSDADPRGGALWIRSATAWYVTPNDFDTATPISLFCIYSHQIIQLLQLNCSGSFQYNYSNQIYCK